MHIVCTHYQPLLSYLWDDTTRMEKKRDNAYSLFSVTKLTEEAELLCPQEARCIISRYKITVILF